MRARDARLRPFVRLLSSLGIFTLILGGPSIAARAAAPAKGDVAEGKAIFVREWIPGDARSHSGDGLGPVYNDSSCVACHNAGATGGAGPVSKNVDILSAFVNRPPVVAVTVPRPGPGFLRRALKSVLGIEEEEQQQLAAAPAKAPRPDTTELVKAHAGFRTARSVVLHRFGTSPDYESWRLGILGINQFANNDVPGMAAEQRAALELTTAKALAQFDGNLQFQNQAQFGEFALSHSQRNPTALFGSGLIDAIPDEVLEAAAKVKYPKHPEIAGRVARQKDGRIGRFGWKAQTIGLNDFVRTACAVELGLDVPGHPQGGLPRSPHRKAKGLDLTDSQCTSLVAYVGALPPPIQRPSSDPTEERMIADGRRLFSKVGCANCHSASLGEVASIYSDLLLHDMGPELGDTGSYGAFVPDDSEPDFVDPDQPLADGAAPAPGAGGEAVVKVEPAPPALALGGGFPVVTTQTMMGGSGGVVNGTGVSKRPTKGPAGRQEWRTPPLWGVRDSGPYLHDGRAPTLERAIALHGGEAEGSARDYFALTPEERFKLQTFLKSLVAPTEPPAGAGG
jgi:CxxC motif-containing protein (DUF1111 family)